MFDVSVNHMTYLSDTSVPKLAVVSPLDIGEHHSMTPMIQSDPPLDSLSCDHEIADTDDQLDQPRLRFRPGGSNLHDYPVADTPPSILQMHQSPRG